MFVWTSGRIAAGIVILIYQEEIHSFEMERDLVICSIVCFIGDFIYFFMIAFVIYKHSIITSKLSSDG